MRGDGGGEQGDGALDRAALHEGHRVPVDRDPAAIQRLVRSDGEQGGDARHCLHLRLQRLVRSEEGEEKTMMKAIDVHRESATRGQRQFCRGQFFGWVLLTPWPRRPAA